jgi:hypothetical protein
MAKFKHSYFGNQLDGMAQELSKLAIACDIKMFEPGMAERILKNDASVCGRSNPEAFKYADGSEQREDHFFTATGQA